MIITMMNIDELKQSILYVVIEADNFERMEKADPITLESKLRGGMLPVPLYPQNFSVLIGYEADRDKLYKMAAGDRKEFLTWLERGRKWVPGRDGVKAEIVHFSGKAAKGEA